MVARASPDIPLWPLPIAGAACVLLDIHLSYVLAAFNGHVPWCIPYWENCTSISAAGRQLPEKLLFKPLLILACVLVAGYWWLMARWLRDLGDAARAIRTMAVLGVTANVFLIAYAAGLGEGGDSAQLLRRAGAALGFSLNYLAEVLLVQRLLKLPAVLAHSRRLIGLLRWLLVVMLLLGMTTALLPAFSADYEHLDDAFEWQLALAINVFIALTAMLWHRTGFCLRTDLCTGLHTK